MRGNMRPNYFETRRRLLDTFFEACRRLGPSGRPFGGTLGYVACQYEGGFEGPLEQLMFDVTLLVLAGPWHAGASDPLRREVARRLRLPEFAAGLSRPAADQRAAFDSDLAPLGLAMTLQASHA